MDNEVCCKAASKKSNRLNHGVYKLLVNWLNKIEYSAKIDKITGLKELKEGSFLFYLVRLCMLNSNNNNNQQQQQESQQSQAERDAIEAQTSQIRDQSTYFEIIDMVYREKFLITTGLDLQLAQQGNEIELAKLSIIVLANGVALEVNEILQPFDQLDKANFDVFNMLYVICDKNKAKFPPNEIHIYELFLFQANNNNNNNRNSLSGGDASNFSMTNSYSNNNNNSNNNTNHQINNDNFSPDSPVRKNSSSENMLSPFSRTSLNSPSHHQRQLRKRLEEEFFREKKKLQKEIVQRDDQVYELNVELEENKMQLDAVLSRIVEFERRLVDFNKYKEKSYEYDLLLPQHDDLEKEKVHYEQKCKQLSTSLATLKGVNEQNEKLETQLAHLSTVCGNLEKKEKVHIQELQHLRNCAHQMKASEDNCLQKEAKILELISENNELQQLKQEVHDQVKKIKSQYEDAADTLQGENALLLNEKSSLVAQLANLKADHAESVKALLEKNSEADASHESLRAVHKLVVDDNKALTQKNGNLNVDMKLLMNQNGIYANVITQKEEDIQRMDSEFKDFKEESNNKLNALGLKCKGYENDLDSLASKLFTSEQQLVKSREDQKNERIKLTQKIDELEASEQSLSQKLIESGRELDSYATDAAMRIKQLETDLLSSDHSLQRLNERLNLERDERERLDVESTTKVGQFKADIVRLNEQIVALESGWNEAKRETQSLQLQMAKQKSVLQCEIDGQNEKIASLYIRIEKDKECHQVLLANHENSHKDSLKKIKDFLLQIDSLRQELTALSQEKVDLKLKSAETLKQLQSQLDQSSSEMTHLNCQIETTNNNYALLKKTSSESQKQSDDLIATLKSDLAEMTRALNVTTNKFNLLEFEAENNVKRLGAELARVNEEITTRTNNYKDESTRQTSEYEGRLSSLNEQMTLSGEQVAHLNRQLTQLAEHAADLKSDLDNVNSENQSLYDRLNSVETRLDEANERSGELTALNDHLNVSLAELAEERVRVEREFLAAQRDANLKIDQLNNECQRLQGQLKASEENLAHLKSSSDETRTNLENDVDGLTRDLAVLKSNLALSSDDFKSLEIDLNRQTTQHLLEIERLKTELSSSQSHLEQLKMDAHSSLAAYESKHAAIVTYGQQLEVEMDHLRAQNTADVQSLRSQLVQAEQQAASLTILLEQKQAEYAQKLLKSEADLTQTRLNASDLKSMFDKTNGLQAQLVQIHAADKAEWTALAKQHQKKRDDLETDLKKTSNEFEELRKSFDHLQAEKTDLCNSFRKCSEYNKRFAEHYEKKKISFRETESELFSTRMKLKKSDEMCEESVAGRERAEKATKALAEELQFYKEKVKTLSFEANQLKFAKSDLERQLSEATYAAEQPSHFGAAAAGMMTSAVSSNSIKSLAASSSSALGSRLTRGTALSTPKQPLGKPRFSDDSFHKFTSPSLATNSNSNNDFQWNGHIADPEFDTEFSRRFSIDSNLRSVQNNNNNNNVTMGLNRFNTISENEFEEPSIHHKAFQLNNNNNSEDNTQRRLTQIHARNQLSKPHLKSSYALEDLPVNDTTTTTTTSKENRAIDIAPAQQERRFSSVTLKRKNFEESARSPNTTPSKFSTNSKTTKLNR